MNADRATLRKYFERTGCLLTADGSRDNLVHFSSGVELGNLPPPFASAEDEPSGLGLGEGKRHEGEGKEEKKENKGESKQGDVDNPKHDEDELLQPPERTCGLQLRAALSSGW